MEAGEKTGSIRLDDETVKEIILELVYSVKGNKKLAEMPVYKDLEEYFDLDYYSEQLDDTILDVDHGVVSISEEKVQEIEKNFLDLKEDFNVLCSKKEGADDFINNVAKLINTNKKLGDSLSKDIKPLLSQVGVALDSVKTKSLAFNVVLQREISLALVLTEYGINSFVKNSVEERRKKDFLSQTQIQINRIKAVCNKDMAALESLELPRVDSVSQKADEKKTFVKIFTKLEEDLAKIEETLDYYLKNDGENSSEIADIYKPLIGMKGIFAIIGKADLGKVVDKIAEPWKKIIDNGQDSVVREELNESIALVGGLSLLVKAFVANNENTADELYGNLMKTYYKKNASEIDQEINIPSFVTEDNQDSFTPAVEKTPLAEEKPVEEDGFEFNFEIEEQPENQPQSFNFEEPKDNQPVSFSFEETATPIIKEDVAPVEEEVSFNFEESVFSTEETHAIESIEIASSKATSVKEYKEGTNDPDLAEVFLMEAEEVLANMGTAFKALENNIGDTAEQTNLRRYFHTLKGSGRMVGLEFMGEAAWMVEQTLNKCLAGDINFDAQILNCAKEMKAKFEGWVESLKSTNEVIVDLVSVKKTFIAINPEITNHVEISLEDSLSVENAEQSVAEEPKEISLEIPEESFNFDIPTEPVAEEPKEISLEIPEESFNFDIPTEPVTEEPKEMSLEIPEESFSFEIPTEPVAEQPKEMSLDIPEESFSFEIPTEPVAEQPKEMSLEIPEESFSFEIPTESVAEQPKEMSLDIPEESFSFEISTEPVSDISVENKAETVEIPEESFNFEIPAEPVAEQPKEMSLDIAEESFSFEVPAEPVAEQPKEMSLDIPEESFSFEVPAEPVSEIPVEDKVETVEIAEESFSFEIPAEPVAEQPKEMSLDIPEESFSFEIPVENKAETVEIAKEDISFEMSIDPIVENPVEEMVEQAQEDNDTMYINGNPVSIELYDLYKLESASNIESLKSEAHADNDSSVFLTEDFMRYAHTLCSISRSVCFNNLGTLAKKLEEATIVALEKNIPLTQEQMVVVREVVDSFEGFQNLDFTQHPSNFEDLNTKLSELHNQLTNVNVPSHVEKEVDHVSSIDTEALKEELLEEVDRIVNEHNKKLLEDVISREKVSKEFVKELILKIDNLEEQLGEVQEAKKEKEDEFEKKLLDIQEAQAERERLYNKALEVTKNDIRTLAHIIKKKYEVANQAVLQESDREEVTETGLDSQESKPTPDITEIMSEYSVEVKNLTDLVEEVEVKNPITSEDIKEVDTLLNSMGDNGNVASTSNAVLSQEDSQIKELLEKYSFVLTVFEDKVASVQDEIDVDLYEISKEESQEMYENINPLIEQINEEGLSIEDSKALKRHLHTLKGSLRMAGANKVGMLAHRLESLLDYVETRKINLFGFKPLLEKEMNKIAFLMKDPTQALDAKKTAWLDEVVDTSATAASSNIVQENNISTNSEVVERDVVPHVKQEAKKEIKQFIRISSDIVDSAINDAGEIRLSRSSLEDTTSNTKKSIGELKNSSNKLLKMVKEIEVQADAQIQAHSSQLDESNSNFDPLEFDRFTRLQELTRLMSEAVSDIEETITSLAGTAKIQDNAINTQSIVTNNLLSQLLKVRLVPVESISERFYKIARNTAKELGKRVSLEIVGEKTEIDKLILDKVVSPIEHLLRNSIAHGIEMPEKRSELGKQPVGKITLDVALEGNSTIIKIQDDGAGINTEKIREIAIKKGMIKEDLEYSKDEIINLIFQSGFSTADSVSQVAGRGVGMDVVKNDILAVGGTIKIDTEKNKGSVFTLTLPMEVATSQAMLCKVRDKLVAIPAILIEEVDSVKEEDIKTAYKTATFTINGTSYPFYYAGALLGLVDVNVIPDSKLYNNIIRVNYMGQSIVVHVDKLLTTTEILIKSLGTIYNKITGLLGVTILGDGSQGVVINPVQLLEHFNKNLKKAKISINIDSEKEIASSRITVLVVDDSITVRRASSKMLERNNFNVVLAKDGEDALEQLQIHSPNIILSDIEMPRMDGFEFVKNVRSVDKYSHIPIIMITSRTADKHQKHAFELGANDFLGKPYKEEELIEKIQNLLEYNKELV
jgi:chemosensory pili system protein ChpA (sensor histidine kinase/response regulator)